MRIATENLIDLANLKSIEIDIRNILKMDGKIKNNDLSKIALLLNIELEDLLIPLISQMMKYLKILAIKKINIIFQIQELIDT